MFSESKVKQQNKIVFSKYNLRDKKVFWKGVPIPQKRTPTGQLNLLSQS